MPDLKPTPEWIDAHQDELAARFEAAEPPDLARRVALSERVLAVIRAHEGDPCPICRRLSRDLEAHYDEKHGGEA